MVTEEQAADFERRLQDLHARGQSQFGAERVDELVRIGQGPAPPEADDPRSLAELMWWHDALKIVAEDVGPLVADFYTRVQTALSEHGVEKPEDLPPEAFVPLEAEAHLNLRVREAAALFGFQL